MNSNLNGILAATMTPYVNNTVNIEELERMNEYILSNGINGIYCCGSTAENVVLTVQERKSIAESSKKSTEGRAILVVNVSSMVEAELRELLDHAKEIQADAVSVVAPSYFDFDELALKEYFKWVADLCDDMPLILYNIPSNVKNNISYKLLQKLCNYGSIAGVKDSSMDYMNVLNYRVYTPDSFCVFTGNDAQIVPTIWAGGNGAVAGTANIIPATIAGMYGKCKNGDFSEAMEIQKSVLKLRDILRTYPPMAAHKEAMRLLGFNMGEARIPLRGLNPEERKRLKEQLLEWENETSLRVISK